MASKVRIVAYFFFFWSGRLGDRGGAEWDTGDDQAGLGSAYIARRPSARSVPSAHVVGGGGGGGISSSKEECFL
ncbi:hypothetical protein LZ31DRAFT_557290 [Colletotrichum somersetense]|nr:hypothetical protein LZ31DRAFT_557290 [Colletotrichum somersetense]